MQTFLVAVNGAHCPPCPAFDFVIRMRADDYMDAVMRVADYFRMEGIDYHSFGGTKGPRSTRKRKR